MRALILAAPIVVAQLLISATGWAQTIAMGDVGECLSTQDEGAFVQELRLRLPESTLIWGRGDADWQLKWSVIDTNACHLDVTGGHSATLDVPRRPSSSDLELAASQVTWLVSMGSSVGDDPVQPVDEAPKETSEPKAQEPESQDDANPPSEDDPGAAGEDDGPQVVATIVPGIVALAPGATLPAVDAHTTVAATSFNVISPRYYGVSGLQLSLFFGAADRFLDGVQLTLGANSVSGSMRGLQIATGANLLGDASRGMQIAAGFNGAQRLEGSQIAAGVNLAESADLQLAAGVNIGSRVGVQAAVVTNVARDVTLQGGLVNVADDAAIQVGLVNISSTAVVPLGLINIMTQEPAYADVFATSTGMVLGGVVHGGSLFRYMYLAGGRPGAERSLGAFGLGASFHFPLGPIAIDAELMGLEVFDDPTKLNFHATLRAILLWQVLERLAIYAGPAAARLWTTDATALGLPPESATLTPGSPNQFDWLEWHVGLRF